MKLFLHVESVKQRTDPADGGKYGPIAHEIVLIAGDQVEQAGADLNTAEGWRQVCEVLADWLVVVLAVASDESLLALQTDPDQLELVVPRVLETLQSDQLLAGVDGDHPLGLALGLERNRVAAHDEGPPVPVTGGLLSAGPLPESRPVTLQLEQGAALGGREQTSCSGRHYPSVQENLLPAVTQSHVARYTSHVTCYTSQVTCQTSHLTFSISHIKGHTVSQPQKSSQQVISPRLIKTRAEPRFVVGVFF